MKKEKYEAPKVLEELALELEKSILQSSVVTDDVTVETTGQDFETYDLSGDEFNHLWEN